MVVNRVYVLAKNESANIAGCLDSLGMGAFEITVLDSGSTDGTREIAESYDRVQVTDFEYVDHCQSYNSITAWHDPDEWVVVLDADMRVNAPLMAELNACIAAVTELEVVMAPVQMFWEGRPVPRSSLCPPKAFALRGGAEHFVPIGHGEQLRSGIHRRVLSEMLVHDDRKPLEQVLANQVRYSKALVERAKTESLTWRDRIRILSPIMLLLTPFHSYFLRRGFLDGTVGLVYAIDRLIAEALMFRASIVDRMDRNSSQSTWRRPTS